jgi:hypothetical protein
MAGPTSSGMSETKKHSYNHWLVFEDKIVVFSCHDHHSFSKTSRLTEEQKYMYFTVNSSK